MGKEVFKAVRVTDGVYWVGAVDWSVRDFHGYLTSRGTTYNAYLVLADRITLVDTVRAPFMDELVARISSIVDPGDIEIIISNHAELDHSGCLPRMIDLIGPERVYASRMGVKNLGRHFHGLDGLTAVKDCESVSLGNMDVTFIETRMLHWPDSMVSYIPQKRLLFSQDAFGMHLASYERFADEIDHAVLEHEAEKYYANILMPYSPLIPKAVDKLNKCGVEPSIVAPDHGPIRRTADDIGNIIGKYTDWASQKPGESVVVVYDTMWGSTDLMARSVCEGVQSTGTPVKLLPLRSVHRSDVATAILDAGALVVGSPTINNNIFPSIADVMSYLKGLKRKNLVGAVFGSYGWSGEAVTQLEALFDEMKIELAAESVNVEYVPDEAALERCCDLGIQVAKTLTTS